MLVSIEGPIGVGKSTLVRICDQLLQCHPVYEDVERNPFLEEFYRSRSKRELARHVQYTFLFLQEQQLRKAQPFSEHGELVVCDFHPVKSLIFSKVILSPEEQAPLTALYGSLSIPQPDLIVYLKADEHTILSRVRKRGDPYMHQIDLTYVLQVCSAYDTFFKTYNGPFMTIDTSRLDYYARPQDVHIPLQHMQTVLNVFPYLKSPTSKPGGPVKEEQRRSSPDIHEAGR